jgi:Peptidase MA superfamily
MMRRIVVLVGFLWACFAVPTANAASPDFGTPTIEGSFGKDLIAAQPVTLDAAPDRVEVLVKTAEDAPPLVAEVPPPSRPGFRRFEYTIASPEGPFLPNTPVVVRWRITTNGTASLSPEVRTVIKDDRFDWQTVSGDVVRVHWYEGDRAFGERALQIGERAMKETADLLGVTEDRPVDFFIYADQDSFYDALGPGTRENVGGQANADIRTLFAHIPPSAIDDPWVDNVVPHELVHLVFDTAVDNPYHFPPRWLNEGLAVYLSVGYSADDRSAVEDAARNGDLIPLDGLTGQFPTSAYRFGLAYSESVSSVDFFVRTHGRDALIQLIRSYAGGRTDDEAFTAAIGMDVAAFNDAWMADLGAVDPKRYGPRPAPTAHAPTTIVPPPERPGPAVTTRTWLLVAILGAVLIASAVLFIRARGRRTSRRPIVPGP